MRILTDKIEKHYYVMIIDEIERHYYVTEYNGTKIYFENGKDPLEMSHEDAMDCCFRLFGNGIGAVIIESYGKIGTKIDDPWLMDTNLIKEGEEGA